MIVPLDVGITRLVISLALGGLIGLERELHQSPAGLRTISLVSLGATLFTLASLAMSGPDVDVSRIAAQIVVGIGFIGAGAIWQSTNKVHGLTTAASLWCAAAIGLMVGIGEYALATTTSVLVVLVLWLGRFEKRYLPHEKLK